MRHYSLHILFLHNQNISRENITFQKIMEQTLTTQLAEPLTAKKKFIDSLTYYKKYLGDNHESSPEVQDDRKVVRPTITVKRGRSVPRVRKIKPTVRRRKTMIVKERAIEAEAEIVPEVQDDRKVVRPTITVKRGRSVPRVRKIKPTVRRRKKTLIFTVQEVVAEEESAFEPEVVAEKEMTPEQFMSIDVDELSEDDFYKILSFLESERKRLDEDPSPSSSSWIKHTR
jgi:hypothetical protein